MNRDELELIALEVSEVKSALRELSQQVLRIERQLKAVLPAPKIVPKAVVKKRLNGGAAAQIIERLTDAARRGEQIENQLRQMTVKNELAALARELGMTNTKLPPKDELIRRISTRIRQKASVVGGIRESLRKAVR